ncbi:glycyl-radical enzyme activating protein [Sporanaerobacter acetigenes]|uniref:Pyruvate formate lyase activating enzyme n=1 Tax=Sporanaerobacter acetigenes DSM 13106 TaxID=1123281 RepID=A0A1M5X8C0_9FIRM|nr:glycyl-radical enzyme activating protein [Sporanaerobacter acetigenes]SHH95463.1 pyruvate formate lyase activating enzyme [Sporanaerobacter acetigenes DSM 13106]
MGQGYIFNIQRFSIHDGPGIRTTIFLKGCPLRCWWCHNPEGQILDRELAIFKNRCIGCGGCKNICEINAATIKENKVFIERQKCNLCGKCVEVCPGKALEFVGKLVTDEWVINEVEKDAIFYDESNGGATISGGEPLMQFDFLFSIVKGLKKSGIHVAVDTSGYAEWEKIEKLIDEVDLFLYDIKLINDVKHKKYTGVSNKVILDNIEKLLNSGANVIPRIPFIPGINDDLEDIKEFSQFLGKLGVKKVNILPYHDYGREKYSRFGKEYRIPKDLLLSDEKKELIEKEFNKKGISIIIGG